MPLPFHTLVFRPLLHYCRYDAAGVRRHAGKQAEVLNALVEDYFQGHPVSEQELKERLGHTPLQVGAGAVLGVVVALAYHSRRAIS